MAYDRNEHIYKGDKESGPSNSANIFIEQDITKIKYS